MTRKKNSSFLLLLLFIACVNSPQNKENKFNPKDKPFSFLTPAQVLSIEVDSFNPETSTRWSAKVERNPEVLFPSAFEWKITEASNPSHLLDTLGNFTWINHFLSTLTTLQVVDTDLNGSDSTFGLDRPRYRFKIKSTQSSEPLILIIGQEKSTNRSYYTRLSETSSSTVYTTTGAAFEMLKHLKLFEDLRYKKLATVTIDDVESFSLSSNKQTTFKAERMSGEWGNEKHKIYTSNVNDWFERVLHLEIISYSDENKKVFDQIDTQKSQPVFTLTLNGRSFAGKKPASEEIRFYWISENLFATNNRRKEALFQLAPKSINYLVPPKKEVK